ncbi:MFS transporter [Nonomuraea sp. NPDC046570]|uniref:MFS transporter n=1 Tax=Nonomuraea sp. NPDC046570 TaxID=3155255 RepID=UPI0033C09C30
MSYREVFTIPGTKAFASAGFLARMPQSMAAIGIVTMLARLGGGFGLAGAVAATFTLSTALAAPQISRLTDRYGQSRVLPPATALSVLSLAALLLCAHLGAPTWTLFVFALPAGFMPNMGAMTRARWSELYRNSPRLHTAFSLESVLDEMTYIIGPALSVGLSTAVFPEAGPLAAALFLAVGVTLFVMQRRTEPPVVPRTGAVTGSILRVGALRLLAVALAALATSVGALEVVIVAFAGERGQSGATGAVLAAYAVGSCLAGLVFGTLKISAPPERVFVVTMGGMAVATLPLLLVDGMWSLAAVAFLSAALWAPTMITVMAMVARIVPEERLTEGLTWVLTGMTVGLAAGSSVGGWVVDAAGSTTGFWVSITAAFLALGIAVLGRRALRATLERGVLCLTG